MEREFCGFSARNLFVVTYGRESDLYSARNVIADQSERKFAFKSAQIVVAKQYGRKITLKPARNLIDIEKCPGKMPKFRDKPRRRKKMSRKNAGIPGRNLVWQQNILILTAKPGENARSGEKCPGKRRNSGTNLDAGRKCPGQRHKSRTNTHKKCPETPHKTGKKTPRTKNTPQIPNKNLYNSAIITTFARSKFFFETIHIV